MSNTQTAGRKSQWLLLILLVLVAAGGSSAGMYFLLGNKGQAAAAPAPEPQEIPEPIFVAVKPFTVNLRSEQDEERLLYIGLSLKVENQESEQFLQKYMPEVRSRLLTLLASKTAAELLTSDGKQQLSAKIIEVLRQPMALQQPELRLTDVLYTEFIVQ